MFCTYEKETTKKGEEGNVSGLNTLNNRKCWVLELKGWVVSF